ncbi:hypothetical protein [Sphingobium yanoikuyae]|uniref:hypothetical protein n=1 Tax=Sphingobium yanoikuyae TaxID=13690 RepID=UPI002FDAC944
MEWVKGYIKRDGKKKLHIFKKANAIFQFIELTVDLVIEPDEELFEEGEIYWGCAHTSGLYDSSEAAETDAKRSVPWLRRGNYIEASGIDQA